MIFSSLFIKENVCGIVVPIKCGKEVSVCLADRSVSQLLLNTRHHRGLISLVVSKGNGLDFVKISGADVGNDQLLDLVVDL